MKIACRPQLWRLAKLDFLIRTRRFPNAASAARELEVNCRTVKRDLEFLRDALHAPLEYSHENHGYFYTERDFALPLVRVTEGELLALVLAAQLLQKYGATPLAHDLQAAFGKITSLLPADVTLDLRALGQTLSTRPGAATPLDAKILRTLTAALRRQCQLHLVYWTASRNETTQRQVDPYHLALIGDNWYLIGYCHLRQRVLTFLVARVRSVRRTGETLTRPEEFRIDDYLDGCFRALHGQGQHRVALRFSREVAGRVKEKIWHKSQQIDEAGDGGVLVRLEVSDLREVLSWALSWGAECEVLEPAEFREMMKREVAELGMKYRQ